MLDFEFLKAIHELCAVPLPQRTPTFPMPALNGSPPVVLIFDPEDPGIEIAYEKEPSNEVSRVRSATRETTLYAIPRLVPIFAVTDGRVVYAREHTDGNAIVIHHASGWATY